MPDPITFMTRLTDAEWDPVVGGWTCPVLQIPGAVVEGIYVEGSQIDSGKFQVLQGQHIIRWMPPEKPPRIAVIISLTQELALGSETDKWRRRAIILPFAATVASALITAIPTYWSKLDTPAKPTSIISQMKPPTGTPVKVSDDDSRIPQWIPRYPGANIEGFSIQGSIASYYFKSFDGVEVVRDFFDARFRLQGMNPRSGYDTVQVLDGSSQIRFLLRKTGIEQTNSGWVSRYAVTFNLDNG